MEWIKVGDRLPENGKRVLVTCSNGSKDFPAFSIYIASCYNRDGKGEWIDQQDEYAINGVVAWMPLPEPFVEPYIIEQFETYDNCCWQIRQ